MLKKKRQMVRNKQNSFTSINFVDTSNVQVLSSVDSALVSSDTNPSVSGEPKDKDHG